MGQWIVEPQCYYCRKRLTEVQRTQSENICPFCKTQSHLHYCNLDVIYISKYKMSWFEWFETTILRCK